MIKRLYNAFVEASFALLSVALLLFLVGASLVQRK